MAGNCSRAALLMIVFLGLGAGKVSARKVVRPVLDSLLSVMNSAKPVGDDSAGVELLKDIAYNYSAVCPDTGIYYANKALALARKMEWNNGLGGVYNSLAVNYYAKTDYPKAIDYFGYAVAAYEKGGLKSTAADILNNLGTIYYAQGNYDTALLMFNKAITTYRAANDVPDIGQELGNIGNVYYAQNNYPAALESYFKALRMFAGSEVNKNTANITGNIGNVYYDNKETDKAIQYFDSAINMFGQLGQKDFLALFHTNLGNAYAEKKDLRQSIVHYITALRVGNELEAQDIIADVTADIGLLYQKTGNYPFAIACFRKSLSMNTAAGALNSVEYNEKEIGQAYLLMAKDTGQHRDTITALDSIGHLKAVIDSFAQPIPKSKTQLLAIAEHYYHESIKLCMKTGVPNDLKDNYDDLAEIYRMRGDYKNALLYTDKYTRLKDSLYSKENDEKLVRLAMQFNFDRQRDADSLRDAAQLLLQQQTLYRQKKAMWLSIAGLALLTILFVIIVRNYGLLRAEKKRSDVLLSQKGRLLNAVSHDLRSPVGCALFLVESLKRGDGALSSETSLGIIEDALTRALNLTSDLLQYDHESVVLNKQSADMREVISSTVRLLTFKAEEKNQTLQVVAPNLPVHASVSVEKMQRLWNNLIYNAIKFSPAHCSIVIKIEAKQASFVVSVKDNGIGIPLNLRDRLFDMFTPAQRTGTAGEASHGLGLSICKLIVEQHDGKIWFDSIEGCGSTFFVELPL